MSCRLWVPVCLVLVFIASSSALFTELGPQIRKEANFYQGNSTGKGSITCPKTFRVCHKEGRCDDKGHCSCGGGLKGDGILGCVPRENGLCKVAADPHLINFGGARVDLDIPCKYRLARYVADASELTTEHSHCSVEVFATNELYHNRFYVRSVHIAIGVGDYGDQGKHVFEVTKSGDVHDFETNEEKMFKYSTNITKTQIVWGSAQSETVKGVNIVPMFDQDDSVALIQVPECRTEIRYRAYDKKTLRQSLMPGIYIIAPPDAKFVDQFGGYPAAVCGSYNVSNKIYENRQESLGLNEINFVPIYDILGSKPPQVHNPNAESCEAAIDAFGDANDKSAAMNACGPILTGHKKRRCLLRSGAEPIDVFVSCFRFYSNNLSGSECSDYNAHAAACGLQSHDC